MPIKLKEKVVHKVCRDLPHPYFSSPKEAASEKSLVVQAFNMDFI